MAANAPDAAGPALQLLQFSDFQVPTKLHHKTDIAWWRQFITQGMQLWHRHTSDPVNLAALKHVTSVLNQAYHCIPGTLVVEVAQHALTSGIVRLSLGVVQPLLKQSPNLKDPQCLEVVTYLMGIHWNFSDSRPFYCTALCQERAWKDLLVDLYLTTNDEQLELHCMGVISNLIQVESLRPDFQIVEVKQKMVGLLARPDEQQRMIGLCALAYLGHGEEKNLLRECVHCMDSVLLSWLQLRPTDWQNVRVNGFTYVEVMGILLMLVKHSFIAEHVGRSEMAVQTLVKVCDSVYPAEVLLAVQILKSTKQAVADADPILRVVLPSLQELKRKLANKLEFKLVMEELVNV